MVNWPHSLKCDFATVYNLEQKSVGNIASMIEERVLLILPGGNTSMG